jgi:hypothetical protein
MADTDNLNGGRSRRKFLQALGAAVGGVAVSGAGATGFGSNLPPGQRTGPTVIPSSYAFYRVLSTEHLLPWPGNPGKLNPVSDMTGVVLMGGATPRIFMHVTLDKSAIPPDIPTDPLPSALMLATMDYSQRPTIADLRIVAYEGQLLDGNNIIGAAPELLPVRVDRIGTGDTNYNGLYATTITSEDLSESVAVNSAPGVYLYDPATDRWTQKARFGDVVDDDIEYGGIFGDVALADDDSVIFTAGTTEPVAGYGGSQSLMLAPPNGGPREHKAIVRTGDMLQGSNAVVDGIGLIDASGFDGSVAAQVFASRRNGRNRELGTALVHGNIYQGARSMRVLAASPQLVSPQRNNFTIGETFMGPRVAGGGMVSYITHTDAQHSKEVLSFTRGSRQFQMQQSGKVVQGMQSAIAAVNAPVVSSTGLVFDTAFLQDGTTALTVSDGETTRVLLSSGDFVEGLMITNILFGCHPRNVDGGNRLAFTAEFLKQAAGDPNDPDNVLTAMVVGVPI